jgi:hypothetical protein
MCGGSATVVRMPFCSKMAISSKDGQIQAMCLHNGEKKCLGNEAKVFF